MRDELAWLTGTGREPLAITARRCASKDGAAPAWDGAGCSASYCHGRFTGGKPANVPEWTAPRANACGSCHGLPPPKPHPASTDCGKCHPGYTSTSVNAATSYQVNWTPNQSGTFNYVKVFTPSLINEVRLGVVRWNQNIEPLGNSVSRVICPTRR